MQCEVIVIGAGIGGLTAAARLAARGFDVCLFERQSVVGGCVANFSHLGYTFEPTFGLYSGWGADGVWQQIFADLPVKPPLVKKLAPNYVVRLPDGRNVSISSEVGELEHAVGAAFPDCADAAIRFLRVMTGTKIAEGEPADLLARTSREFRLFIDAQLTMFAQFASSSCPLPQAAEVLRLATGDLWSIEGGAQALADRLAESLKTSGGSLRLNSPVLRLAYQPDGQPAGIDLLNGERVIATRAIVSNLTVWDTYGKLVGPGRTPKEVATQLKGLSAWGAYQMFLGLDQTAVDHLPSPRTLLVFGSNSDDYDPEQQQLMMHLSESSAAAPDGKRALVTTAFSQAQEWFAFHEDHSWHEEKDQATLETWWQRLHQALPELGDALEVIETSTPQTTYESTRRRFGMIFAPTPTTISGGLARPFSNVFLAGDTVARSFGLAGVGQSSISVADQIAK